jgi:hypothetical protein
MCGWQDVTLDASLAKWCSRSCSAGVEHSRGERERLNLSSSVGENSVTEGLLGAFDFFSLALAT